MWLLRTDVSGVSSLERVMCPNGCCDLTLLKKRRAMLYLVPEDLLDYLDGKEILEGAYGYLAGVCSECGFVLITEGDGED